MFVPAASALTLVHTVATASAAVVTLFFRMRTFAIAASVGFALVALVPLSLKSLAFVLIALALFVSEQNALAPVPLVLVVCQATSFAPVSLMLFVR